MTYFLFSFFRENKEERKKNKKQTKKRERKWDRLAQWGNLQRSGESRAIQSERKVLISIAGGWFCSSLSLFLFSKSSIFFCVSPSLLLCFVSTPFNWWQCENFSDSQQYNHSSDEKKKRFVSFVIFCFLFFLLLPRRGTKKKNYIQRAKRIFEAKHDRPHGQKPQPILFCSYRKLCLTRNSAAVATNGTTKTIVTINPSKVNDRSVENVYACILF